VAVSSFLQNRYDICVLDNEKSLCEQSTLATRTLYCVEKFSSGRCTACSKSWRSHFKTLLWNKATRTATEERALHSRRTPASYLVHACQTHVWESGTLPCAEKLTFRPPSEWLKLNFPSCCFNISSSLRKEEKSRLITSSCCVPQTAPSQLQLLNHLTDFHKTWYDVTATLRGSEMTSVNTSCKKCKFWAPLDNVPLRKWRQMYHQQDGAVGSSGSI